MHCGSDLALLNCPTDPHGKGYQQLQKRDEQQNNGGKDHSGQTLHGIPLAAERGGRFSGKWI